MDRRIVDPNKFILLGGLTDWSVIAKSRERREPITPSEIARSRGLESGSVMQLRWLTAKTMGYPTEPFTVWRRPASIQQELKPASSRTIATFTGVMVVSDVPYVFVQFELTAPVGSAIRVWSGAPMASTLVGSAVTTVSMTRMSFSATAIHTIELPFGASLNGLLALDDSVAEAPDWEPIETVGLPVRTDWANIGGFGAPQGFVAAPVDPRQAAFERFQRGAPFYGWDDELFPGTPAPPWQLADPKAMIETVQKDMLDDLRQMVITLPPEQHAQFQIDQTLASNGGNLPVVLHHRPLEALLYGAATDGLASLIAGYGTAFHESMFLDDRHGTVRVRHDYMVTARYENGVGNEPGPVEFAAILYAPGALGGIPAPSGLTTEIAGLTSPPAPDEPWSPVIRVGWDALAAQLGHRVGSYAFARANVAPARGVTALMQARPRDTALQPLGLGMPTAQETRRYGTDDDYQIDSNTASNALTYAVAHHDLFGIFSRWSTVNAAVSEPPVERATITSARLDVANGGSGALCPATLVVEFAWNWAVRTPDFIQISGRLYPQAKLGDAPADLSIPPGLATTVAAPGSLLTIDLAPDGSAAITGISSGLAATLRHLSPDGRSVIAAPSAAAGPRRYQVEVVGYRLDFDAAARQGLALWVRGREARAPGRVGDWSSHPVIASTSDPRPPMVTNTREFVQLASLADADGIHHAVLNWAPAQGAVAYFAYNCAEERFLADRGLNPSELSLTLEERLVILRDAFQANPDRRSFARINSTPVTGTRMPITFPRGSKELHLYVVLGVSGGGVESEWPDSGSPGLRLRFVAYAAPHVTAPATPQLEVASAFDNAAGLYKASVRIKSAPGARVKRIDLHRVRVPDAALAVESMGPAVAEIDGTGATFTVAPTVSAIRGEAQPIGTIRGLDPVPGSWKTVFYRAVAWSYDDASRGIIGGRSDASAVRMVVVPPADPPQLSPPAWTPASPGSPAGVVGTAVLAPLAVTPLGPHRISAEALAHHPDGTTTTLLHYPQQPIPSALPDADSDGLHNVPDVPGILWHEATVPTGAGEPGRTPIRVAVPRASFDDALSVRIRITDPLGRLTEHTLSVPTGIPVQPPDIIDPETFRILGRGTVIQFSTTAPDTDSTGRPYLLHIVVRPRILRPPAQRPRIDIALADITPGVNLGPASASTISVGRSDVDGRTQITALVRSTGSISLALEAPDGTIATWRGRL